ncbi:SgcJ/EcaC family oxidoreductase [Nocardia sp. XZ_19_385]|uniref:SgcJ/EcaC family oxidoreductase n=1 Tax=Nocardia sp. XZ_19_385 TaxID=2769488 RepID=UPI001E2BEA8C|nr:SgcJ/EcaC family oxidoreductase [Nocardia sp. XZ_19_385]
MTTQDDKMASTAVVAEAKGPASGKSPKRRRRLLRVLGIGLLAVVAAVGGGYLWLDATSDVHNTGHAECASVTPTGQAAPGDREAVCGVLESLIDAWDRNDADAYGAQFTEDATYATYVGSYYEGRADIVNSHKALFAKFLEGSKLANSYLGIRFLSPDAAIVTGRGDDYTGDAPAELSKVQTYTLVRQADGQWRVAAFHNTQRKSVMERFSFILSPDTRPEAEK